MSEERGAVRRGSQRSGEGKWGRVAGMSRVGFVVIGDSTQAFREATKADFPSFLSSLESAQSLGSPDQIHSQVFLLKGPPRHTSVPNIME